MIFSATQRCNVGTDNVVTIQNNAASRHDVATLVCANNRCCDLACNITLKLGQKAQGDEDGARENRKNRWETFGY